MLKKAFVPGKNIPMEIAMKKAIVTGASSGIGAAIAAALVSDDYEVYGIGRDYKKQEELTQNPMFRPLV